MPVTISDRDYVVEERTSNSALAITTALLVLAVVIVIGFFAFWAPAHQDSTPAVIDHQTVVHDQTPTNTIVTPPPSTIITTPSTPGPQGAPGPSGPQGEPGPSGSSGTTTPSNSSSSSDSPAPSTTP